MRRWLLQFLLLVCISGSIARADEAGTAREQGMRVVTFGTSLSARGGWQEPLAKELQRCLGERVEVLDRSKSGASSNWGVNAFDDVVTLKPDIVLIEFAANDAAFNRFLTLRRSAQNIAAIVEGIRSELPSVEIYLMAMSPVIGVRGWIRPFLNAYYASYAPLAQRLGVKFIDHRDDWARLSRRELADAIPDGGHPRPEIAASIIVPRVASAICVKGR